LHAVAYLWKAGKPQWQTVWYAAIRSGGGSWWEDWGWEAACESKRQRAEGEVSSSGSVPWAKEAATNGAV
jgi:hypothetical protein